MQIFYIFSFTSELFRKDTKFRRRNYATGTKSKLDPIRIFRRTDVKISLFLNLIPL